MGEVGLTSLPLARALAGVVMVTCAAVLVTLAAIDVATGSDELLGQAPVIVLCIAVAGWQFATGRFRPLGMLLGIEVGIVIQVGIVGAVSYGAAQLGLAMVATGGVMILKSRPFGYIAAQMVVIFAANAWWLRASPLPQILIEGVVVVAAFVFAAFLVVWMRRSMWREQHRYRNLFDNAPTPLWEIDFTRVMAWLGGLPERGQALRQRLEQDPALLRRGVSLVEITGVNDAALEWLGSARRHVLGRIDPDTMPTGIDQVLLEHMVTVSERRARSTVEVSGVNRHGVAYRGVFSIAISVRDGELDVSRMVTTMTDVTTQHFASERLRDLVRSKDEFIAAVSHELRTPLTAVVGLAMELEEHYDAFGPDEIRDFIGLIARESREVAAIVEDLLVAARDVVGAVPLECEPFDLVEAVDHVASGMGAAADLTIDITGPDAVCWGDPARLRQILRNLLVNAQRYGGSRVRLVVTSVDGGLAVEVRDDGAPVPAELRDAIFVPYYSAHGDVAPQSSVGLGLTVSRQLARRMGGEVSYRHDGRESIFSVQLPRAAPERVPAVMA